MKIAMVCSSGGHLAELMALKSAVKKYDRFWITFKSPITRKTLKGEKFYLVDDPRRNPIKFIPLFFKSLKFFWKERPDVVITTGAGVAIPFCMIAKMFRKKLIFVESFARTKTPSITGRVLYPMSDLFLVQWRKNREYYGKNAKYVGPLY
jgi:UDP-N-acetylglucosamine:LPS N-acetylglucosamine transferase